MELRFENIPNTFANQNQLQGICEMAMLKNDYRIEFDDYYLLYLGKTEAIVKRLELWAKNKETVDTMMLVLKNRFKKKQTIMTALKNRFKKKKVNNKKK